MEVGGASTLGPLGELGRFAAVHRRRVIVVWLLFAVVLALFAPKVQRALSGAGWEAGGWEAGNSDSVSTRNLVEFLFTAPGAYGLQVVVHSPSLTAADPRFRRTLRRISRMVNVRGVKPNAFLPLGVKPYGFLPLPQRLSISRQGLSISRDGHTAIVRAAAEAGPSYMVDVAGRLKGQLAGAGSRHIEVNLAGSAAMWSDFNEVNRKAMLHSEVLSWPVTLLILILAFGSLVAAGLPLLLTILALIASAGVLYLVTFFSPISIWAMNFALIFCLALGVDYALFLVMRFRNALFAEGLPPVEAVAKTMDTAGRAVLFSGLTVVISLSAVMLIPSPAFRSTALGIILSALFVMAVALTLLPAVLAFLGPRVDKLALPWAQSGGRSSKRLAKWGELLWRRPVLFGGLALLTLIALALPVLGLKTAMPSIKVLPANEQARRGYEQISASFGAGAPATLQVLAKSHDVPAAIDTLQSDPRISKTFPAIRGGAGSIREGYKGGELELIEAIPSVGPSSPQFGPTVRRLRAKLPPSALVGGSAVENLDLESSLKANAPWVIAVVLALGFLLLLLAFRAPLLAAIGVLTNLLSTAAAFGVAKLIFQDGHLSGLLNFEPQGFINAWGPVYFFAMVFAISMDYTVFLFSAMREGWEESQSPREAMVDGLARSGRVVTAAGAVMAAVFFTFALSGPLAPKEMGIILGVAVLLDAFVVRLLLLPVLLRLCGDTAWYLPAWLGRALPFPKANDDTPIPTASSRATR
jgi:RND superfamily putative drug exporter